VSFFNFFKEKILLVMSWFMPKQEIWKVENLILNSVEQLQTVYQSLLKSLLNLSISELLLILINFFLFNSLYTSKVITL
jgi:uncharacterized protein YggT (Ycf19 family)